MYVSGFRFMLAATLVGLSAVRAAADEPSVSLLQLPSVRLEAELVLLGQDGLVPALIDGDPTTVATFPVDAAVPVDLVFGFGDLTVAPESLVVSLSGEAAARPPASIDILVSTTSPAGGFRSMRTEAINGLVPKTNLSFRPAAARWIMLRLYPAPGAASLSVADLVVSGRAGAPQTTYEFGETPAAAIAILQELSALSVGEFALTEEERAVFDRAAAGQFDGTTFEAAALLASGVTEPAKLATYSAAIDRIEAEVRATFDTSVGPTELGSQLLTWLHRRALQGGYREKQTDLDLLLDGGTFNCVSSAVLYTALARRLGLDVRGIEVPDHAFAIVYDGADHMDVETTTELGFNPQRERIAAFEDLTGFTYIPQSDKAKRREIDLAGMAALIYYNHGVGFLDENRYYEAVLANFRAMSLDPEFSSAATNALTALGRWSLDLAEAEQWEDAVRVAAVGRRLAPDDDGLAAQQLAVWQHWALALADSGQPADAIALLRRAANEVPDGSFDDLQAWIFIRPGEALAADRHWQAALSAVGPAFDLLQGPALDQLIGWRRGLFLRWANSEIGNATFAVAADVLARGLTEYPGDRSLLRTVDYLAQEWARGSADYGAGLAALEHMQVRFGDVARIDAVSKVFVSRELEQRHTDQPLEKSLALVEAAQVVLPEEAQAELAALVFELYGHARIEAIDWEGAAAIYAAGLQRFPESRLLSTNARYVVQEWQRQAYAEAGPAGLVEVNKRLVTLLPEFGKGSGEAEVRRRVAELLAESHFAEAQMTIDEAQLVVSPEVYAELTVAILQRRALAAMDAGDWPGAAALLADGLARYPEDRTVARNVVYVAQEWTRAVEVEGGAAAVLEVLELLGQLYPGNEDVADTAFATLQRSVADKIAAGQYDAAQAVIVDAAPHLNQERGDELVEVLYRTWGLSLIDKRDWPGAAASLGEGMAILPDSRELTRNAVYVVQEWSSGALQAGGATAFVATVAAARLAFPGLEDLDRVLEGVLGRAVERDVKAGAPTSALELIAASSAAVPSETANGLREFVYDHWARSYADTGDWAKALQIYERGLLDVPESRILSKNLDHAASKVP